MKPIVQSTLQRVSCSTLQTAVYCRVQDTAVDVTNSASILQTVSYTLAESLQYVQDTAVSKPIVQSILQTVSYTLAVCVGYCCK